MTYALEVDAVFKRFAHVEALRGVSLQLEPGTIGLLGPNGAGKSTLMRCLLGLVHPDRGRIQVFGEDVGRNPLGVRGRVGYMPDGDAIMGRFSAQEYVTLAAELAGIPRREAIGRAHRVLSDVGLGEVRYRPLKGFSTGMKQRARLAQALVGDPKLLLLDEPTSGLDPTGREEMLRLIAQVPERTGATVILSTHILPDVEKTCAQVVLLSEGRCLYAGALSALLSGQREGNVYEVRTKGSPRALIEKLEAGSHRVRRGDAGHLEVRLPHGAGTGLIASAARECGVALRHVAPLSHSLERAFMHALADQNEGPPQNPLRGHTR